jgi:hypothetical protein
MKGRGLLKLSVSGIKPLQMNNKKNPGGRK